MHRLVSVVFALAARSGVFAETLLIADKTVRRFALAARYFAHRPAAGRRIGAV